MLGWWQDRGGQENLILSPREDQCTVASCLGGQSHGVPQDAVSLLPSHVKPHHLPLYTIHTHLHLRFDFQPKQTANPLAATVPVPMATAHKGTALALMIRICRDGQRGQFRASREIWMQAKSSAGHWAWIHKKKNQQCVRLIASNQPSDINTSCHLEETCWTKKALVRFGWDQ